MNYFLNTLSPDPQARSVCWWGMLDRPSLFELFDPYGTGRTDPAVRVKLTELIQPPPSQVFVFLDVHEQSIDSGDFALNRKAEKWEHLPSGRHNQGCNLSFADGHVERYRWCASKKFFSANQVIESDLDRQDFWRLAAGLPAPQ